MSVSSLFLEKMSTLEALEDVTKKKTEYMNGIIYSLQNPSIFQLDEAVSCWRNKNYIILQLTDTDRMKIMDVAQTICVAKPPYNQDGKLFFGVKDLKNVAYWRESKELTTLDEVPMGKFTAKIKLELPRFTLYNTKLSFKLLLIDLMFYENAVTACPF